MKRHHQYDIILAFIQGHPIQYFYHGKWCDWSSESSAFPEFGAYDWRIKPNHIAQLQEMAERLAQAGWISEANLLDEHLAELAEKKKAKVPDREEMKKLLSNFRTTDPVLTAQSVYAAALRSLNMEVTL